MSIKCTEALVQQLEYRGQLGVCNVYHLRQYQNCSFNDGAAVIIEYISSNKWKIARHVLITAWI